MAMVLVFAAVASITIMITSSVFVSLVFQAQLDAMHMNDTQMIRASQVDSPDTQTSPHLETSRGTVACKVFAKASSEGAHMTHAGLGMETQSTRCRVYDPRALAPRRRRATRREGLSGYAPLVCSADGLCALTDFKNLPQYVPTSYRRRATRREELSGYAPLVCSPDGLCALRNSEHLLRECVSARAHIAALKRSSPLERFHPGAWLHVSLRERHACRKPSASLTAWAAPPYTAVQKATIGLLFSV